MKQELRFTVESERKDLIAKLAKKKNMAVSEFIRSLVEHFDLDNFDTQANYQLIKIPKQHNALVYKVPKKILSNKDLLVDFLKIKGDKLVSTLFDSKKE